MRKEGKILYLIELNIKGHYVALVKYLKEYKWENGSWYIQIDQTLHCIRKYIFWWAHDLQMFLYKRRVYWHNWFWDECTPYFECCTRNKKLTEEEREILNKVSYAGAEGVPVTYIKKG